MGHSRLINMRIVSALVIVALATTLFLLIRFYLVEPEALAQACVANLRGWRCVVRQTAVFGFLHNVYGWMALITGAFATIARWRWLAVVAMIAGVGGAVLYTFELSGAGLLLGALVWAYRAPVSDEQSRNEQPA